MLFPVLQNNIFAFSVSEKNETDCILNNFMKIGKIENFMKFVKKAHEGQMYGSNDYFDYHLKGVAYNSYMYQIHNCNTAFIVGLCHDILEDTAITFDELLEELKKIQYYVEISCNRVAGMIESLSDLQGNNRSEKKFYSLTNLKRVREYYNEDTHIIVKLMDRLFNVYEGKKNDMYRKEHREFKLALDDGMHPMLWSEIETVLEWKP